LRCAQSEAAHGACGQGLPAAAAAAAAAVVAAAVAAAAAAAYASGLAGWRMERERERERCWDPIRAHGQGKLVMGV